MSHAALDELEFDFFSERFRRRCREADGTAFQNLFSDLMELRYPQDFVRIRTWGSMGDQKNDGFLRSERKIFACYAPNEVDAATTLAKMDSDFAGAIEHWLADIDEWVFVHNSLKGLGPWALRKLLELDAVEAKVSTQTWGHPELHDVVFSLSREDLEALLGRVPSTKTLLDVQMADLVPLLDQMTRMPALSLDDLDPPPADKVEINLLSSDIEDAIRRGKAKSHLVGRYFSGQSNAEARDQIAAAFRNRYEVLKADGLSPDEIYHQLTIAVGGDRMPSPSQMASILAVMTYFFEECDIFERAGGT